MYIKCPHCGAEYELGEIFTNGEFAGKTTEILKDPSGKILYTNWIVEPQLKETFNCDFCGRDFVIEAEINCKSTALEENVDFSSDSASLID